MEGKKSLFSKIKSNFRDNDGKLKRFDWIIILVLVAIYSIFAFSNLGTLNNPQTFYNFKLIDEEIGFKLTKETNLSKIRLYSGEEVGSYEVMVSNDDITYSTLTSFETGMPFSWEDITLDGSAMYVKIVSKTMGSYIGEIQLYDNYGAKVLATGTDSNAKLLVDEVDSVPVTISHKNSMYFDELYFARSAYEYLHGIPTNEWVHPPLGKLIMTLPIMIMGMNTYAYRLMGAIAGLLMIPVLYALAKAMFKNRKWALLAGLLMMFDCFHLVQTRMGTVDSFLVLFIMLSALFLYKYIDLDKEEPFKKKIINLGLSGLFIGCAIATKWTGLYAGLAEAIILIGTLIYNNFGKDKEVDKDFIKTILFIGLFFIFVPVVIYVISYLINPTIYPDKVNGINGILKQTKEMFGYHSELEETHPFQSKWYTWPLMLKPVWYYVSFAAGNLKTTIVGIGNPAIWWFGIVASIFVFARASFVRNKENVFMTLFILCLWLPYAFIDRAMFMYHFFPVLPFVMLAIVALIRFITNKIKSNLVYLFYIVLVIVIFIVFLPIVTGITTNVDYIESLKWLKEWIF